jgi:hypothetical protein
MNIHDVLEASVLQFRAHPEWRTAKASRYSFNPKPGGTVGVIIHHTVSSKNGGSMPSENIVVNGRVGLAGPLSQFLLARDGMVLLTSQNRCNHAGKGNKKVLDHCIDDIEPPDFGEGAYNSRLKGSYGGGNGNFWGIEVENDGIGEQYSDVQIDALVRLLAALCEWQHWNPLTRIIHHREWTARKIDMSFNGPLRKMVADFIAHGEFEMPVQAIDGDHFSERKLLKLGAKGQEVKELQAILVRQGLALSVDGDFGPNTQRAVKAFQSSRGLLADGIVGSLTWSALFAANR